jgi:hypothetical protein
MMKKRKKLLVLMVDSLDCRIQGADELVRVRSNDELATCEFSIDFTIIHELLNHVLEFTLANAEQLGSRLDVQSLPRLDPLE